MNNTLPKFHELRADRVLNTFKIDKKKHSEHLNNWLQHSEMIMPNDKILLDIALDRYNRLGDGWNEEELKMHFLSLIFDHADIELPDKIKLFYERPLSATVQNTPLNGFSKTYDATRTDELIQIIHILRHLKYRIQY